MTDLIKYHQTETVQFHNGWILQLLKKHTFCYSVLSFIIYCVFSPDTHQHHGCPHISQLTAVQYISGVCIHHMTPRWRFFHTCTRRGTFIRSHVFNDVNPLHTLWRVARYNLPCGLLTRCVTLCNVRFFAWHRLHIARSRLQTWCNHFAD